MGTWLQDFRMFRKNLFTEHVKDAYGFLFFLIWFPTYFIGLFRNSNPDTVWDWSDMVLISVLIMFLLVTIMKHQLPQQVHLCPVSRTNRENYAKHVFWFRYIGAGILPIGSVLFMGLSGQIHPLETIVAIVTVAALDYVVNYTVYLRYLSVDISFLGVLHMIYVMVMMLEVFLITDLGSENHVNFVIPMIFEALIVATNIWGVIHFYRKYYRISVVAMAGYERAQLENTNRERSIKGRNSR